MISSNISTIFFDFDGVIKDSVDIKSKAFEQLFSPFGDDISFMIRGHHEKNGGMSRFDKLPIYLEMAGQIASPQLIAEYAEQFSLLVKQKVINSSWVDGVLDYIQNNYKKQQCFIVTATPQQEIEDILSQLNIAKYFKQVIGSPTSKIEAIEELLNKYNINPQHAAMVGDSVSDYEAATHNQLIFILRQTRLNIQLQEQLNCQMIKDFSDE